MQGVLFVRAVTRYYSRSSTEVMLQDGRALCTRRRYLFAKVDKRRHAKGGRKLVNVGGKGDFSTQLPWWCCVGWLPRALE